MKEKTKSSGLQSLRGPAATALRDGLHYAVIIFVLLVAGVYGFVLYRVYTLANAKPSDAAVSAQVQASATPHIDATAAQQLQALQDNSVNVQTLFNQARSNPFQE